MSGRCDFAEFEQSLIEPPLPNELRGVLRADDRRMLSGVFWVLSTGPRGAASPRVTAPT